MIYIHYVHYMLVVCPKYVYRRGVKNKLNGSFVFYVKNRQKED